METEGEDTAGGIVCAVLCTRVVYGASRAINIKEIAPKESGEPCFTNDMELLNLFKKIRLNSEEEIVEAVD